MSIEAITSPAAPAAIGPYSQATKGGDCIHISGQLPIDATTGKFAGETIEEQTRQSLTNMKHILAEEGLDMSAVAETTVLLADIADFAAMNAVYGEFFEAPFPARAAFQVAALPMGAKVEIKAIAHK